MFRSYDFYCETCDDKFDATVEKDATTEICPVCGEVAQKTISAPAIITGNDPFRRTEMLKKRSLEHSAREMKKNPEKLAAAHGGKPKAQSPWNIRGSKK